MGRSLDAKEGDPHIVEQGIHKRITTHGFLPFMRAIIQLDGGEDPSVAFIHQDKVQMLLRDSSKRRPRGGLIDTAHEVRESNFDGYKRAAVNRPPKRAEETEFGMRQKKRSSGIRPRLALTGRLKAGHAR